MSSTSNVLCMSMITVAVPLCGGVLPDAPCVVRSSVLLERAGGDNFDNYGCALALDVAFGIAAVASRFDDDVALDNAATPRKGGLTVVAT